MSPQINPEMPKQNPKVVAGPEELLAELAANQAAVAADVSALGANVTSLNEVTTTIAASLEEVKQIRSLITAEKLSALEAIQTKLAVALAAIEAASKYSNPDPFMDPKRLGF